MPQNESALCAVLLLLATLLVMQRGKIISGFCMGASILANPISMLPLAVLAIRRGAAWFAVAGGLALLVCSPWIVRNWMVLGAPYFVRDNFGLELFLSNQDQSSPEMINNGAMLQHPSYNPGEAGQVAKIGEGPYNRAKLALAMYWIFGHPGHFLWLCVQRVFWYWFPSPAEGWPAYIYRLVNVLAIVGIWLARRTWGALHLVLAAVCYSLPYVLIQSDLRYSFPMLWVPALLAGFALHELFPWKSSRSRS